MGNAATGAAERVARAQHHGVADLCRNGERVVHGVGVVGARGLEPELVHGLAELLAVLAALDGRQVAADHLDAVLVEHARLGELNGRVEARLAAQGGEKRVGALLLDHALHEGGRDGLDVRTVRELGVGHDGGRVGVDEHDLVAVLFKDLARLGAGVVELAGLADDDGAGADDENSLDICTLRHW